MLIRSNFICVTFITLVIFDTCCGIRFYLQPHTKRCLKHEMYNNQVAVGEYEVTSLPETVIDLRVTDSKGHIALNRENIDGKGKFAISADEPDYYELCFDYTDAPYAPGAEQTREIYVDYKVGDEAKTYEPMDHDLMSEVETNLAKIEDMTNAIIVDFAQLKRRNQDTLDTNDSTNSRLFYQSILTFILLIALAFWQVVYLKTYFRSRKLID